MLQRGSLLYILYISYIYSMHAMSIGFRKRTAFAGTEKHVNIVISNSGDRPIYEQIASQIRDAILSGDLGEGDALPSIRSLATDLRVSVITTKRSYTELESQGFIDTIPGKGSFVAGGSGDLLREQRIRQVERQLEAALSSARSAGLSLSDVHDMIDALTEGAV